MIINTSTACEEFRTCVKQGKWHFYFTGTRSKLAQICDLFTTGSHIVTLKILCNRVDSSWKYI